MGLVWPVGTACAWLFITHHRDIPHVHYVDLLLPHRWARYRQARGEHYLIKGESCLRKSDANAAFHYLRAGVSLVPTNARGRLLLANLYLGMGHADSAEETLLAGLEALSHNPDYVNATFSLLHDHQKDVLIWDTAQKLLHLPDNLAAPARAQVAIFAADAAYQRGQHQNAKSLLRSQHLDNSAPGACLLAKMDEAEGFGDLAVLRLRAYLATHNDSPTVDQQLNHHLQALGRLSEWHTNLLASKLCQPDNPGLRVDLLRYYLKIQDEHELAQEFTRYLRQFSQTSVALLQLADFCAESGRPDLLALIVLPITHTKDEAIALSLLMAESYLGTQRYQEAQPYHFPAGDALPAHFLPTQTGLRAIALCGLGQADEARLQIEHLLGLEALRAESLVALAARFRALGAHELARPLLRQALALAPLHQPALLALISLELDNGTFAQHPEHLAALLRSRQPPRAVLQRISSQLGSDRHILLPTQAALLATLRPALAQTWPRQN